MYQTGYGANLEAKFIENSFGFRPNRSAENAIIKEGKEATLRIFTNTRPNCDDFVNNNFTKIVEETSGVKLEFDVAQESEAKQKLSIVLASGDYPDVIMGGQTALSLAEQALYAKQGVIISLNDLISEYGYGYNMMAEQYPAVVQQYTLDDGNIYTLPDINESYHCTMSWKMWMYTPWLTKLNLSEPTTTEEFYNVLKAFKENDPNGNGQADEIPLAGSTDGWNARVHVWLMNSFVFTDPANCYMYVNNGKITTAFDTEEWKEGLKYMRKLVTDGLLAPETFTQKSDQLKQLALNGRIGTTSSGYQGNFGDTKDYTGEWTKYTVLAPLKGPNGVQYTYKDPYFAVGKVFITDKCQIPEVAFRLFDMFYVNDGSNAVSSALYFGGEKGVVWDDAAEGQVGISGEQALYQKLVTGTSYGDQKNVNWDQQTNSLRGRALIQSWAVLPDSSPMESLLFQGTMKMEPYAEDVDMMIPPMAFTDEEAKELGDLKTTISAYIEETIAIISVSNGDFDKEWDKYISELEKMNVSRLVEIYQTAYDKKAK